jgi:hypothetical protein
MRFKGLINHNSTRSPVVNDRATTGMALGWIPVLSAVIVGIYICLVAATKIIKGEPKLSN